MLRRSRLVAAIAAAVAITLLGTGTAAAATAPGPATPVDPIARNTAAAIQLSWEQPRVGTRAVGFRVYEGATVVARHTSTSVWLANLGFGTTHTYTVTAIDRQGRESAHTAPVTRTVWQGGANPACFPPPALPLVATEVTSSAVSLAWPRIEWPNRVTLLHGQTPVATAAAGARVGGLAPGTPHTFTLTTLDCQQRSHTIGWVTVTTLAGAPQRPTAPVDATTVAATDTSVTLRWSPPVGGSPATRYAVYERGARITTTASTSVTIRRLYHARVYAYTVAALDAAGNESAHSGPLTAPTAPCLAGAPRPVDLRAVAVSASTVRLSWTQTSLADSFTVYDGATAVATTAVAAALLTGLPSASRHTYRVRATLINGCGPTGLSAPATVRTAAGPAARPTAPIGLSAVVRQLTGNSTATVAVSWRQQPGADPVVGYRLYEDAVLVASTVTPVTELTVRTNTRHTYLVTAVDAAGNESPASAPATVQVPFLPPP